MKAISIALVAALTMALSAPAAHASGKKKPSATIELSKGSVAAGIGFSWGEGTLTYKGRKHAITVDGLTVGSVGITRATARGKVYNLNDLKDFDGVYTSATAGATVGGGGSVTTMRNQNGVSIDLVTTSQGAKLTLGPGGVKLALKQ